MKIADIQRLSLRGATNVQQETKYKEKKKQEKNIF
jgi:hypothetical protein